MKRERGITLIALVVTIIVLLILAGVAINLVAGGDGIMAKAQSALIQNNVAEAKERVALRIAEYQTDYYRAVYVEKTVSVNTEMGDWIAQTHQGEILKAGDYEFQITGTGAPYTVTILKNNRIKDDIEGKMSANGKVTWPDAESGGSGDSGEDELTPEPDTKYTVSYNLNDGTGSVPTDAKYAEGATVTVEFPEDLAKDDLAFLGWATNADAVTATYTENGTKFFTMGAGDVILYAVWAKTFAIQIDTSNYGQYVDLETTLLPRGTDGVITQKLGGEIPTEQPLTDWRIFHKDTNGTYLILADYLPYSYETGAVAGSSTGLGTGLLNYGADYLYNWRSTSNRTDLITRLNDTATWSKLLPSTYTAKGITVTGALELNKWVDGWNAKNTTQLNTQYVTSGYNAEGWLVGTANPPTTYHYELSSDAGYGNTLYFPHQVELMNNYGYWLTSISASDTSAVMKIYRQGSVGNDFYNTNDCGVRPAVFIPADITAEKNPTTGIWELDV